MADTNKKPIITLCGSTRFSEQMLLKQWELSKAGHVVLAWNVIPILYFESLPNFNGDYAHGAEAEGIEIKGILDKVHKDKIDLCDEILVINVNDYIGESTKSEILYAIETGKLVKYVYPHTPRDWESGVSVAVIHSPKKINPMKPRRR